MEIKLSNRERNLIRFAFEGIERDVIINERDNPEDFAAYQPYVADGQTTLSNGQKVNLKETTTSEGIKSITITPIQDKSMSPEGLEGLSVNVPNQPEQKTEEEILADTIKKLVDPQTID